MSKRIFRFKKGQEVWVRDRGMHGGSRVVRARVRERHYHPGRHPFYPNGEGYALNGELWWDCYPGCRVYRTREGARKARMSDWTDETANSMTIGWNEGSQ